MILHPGHEQLLLPVKPALIWVSLLAALLLNLLPVGRVLWMPDFLALVLVFWNVHQPRRVGIALAFVFGLIMDVHQAALLGQNALAYSVLTYLAITQHRRLRALPLLVQAVQVLPLFLVAQAIVVGLRVLGGGVFPGWGVFAGPVIEAALWPVVSLFLLAPQRRPPDPDKNRPL